MTTSEVGESFRAPLEELKMNSKPQISMLTMLAEDHEPNASEIVDVIQEQIHKVPATRKLPIMYLVDSIIKNLPKTSYPDIFGNNIVDIFCGVFEEVDELTRSQLYKLRQTWVDILPNKRLYALDVQVKTIDANWPITAKPPNQGVIHVNPKFLKQSKERSPQFSPNHSERNSPKSSPKDEELEEKQKEIQRLKLELEMATIKNQLEQEKKRLEALQEVGRRSYREPPPSIQLPPAGIPPPAPTSVLKPITRDPRLLNRDPRINRDPRLKKVGFQELPPKEDVVADLSGSAVNQDIGSKPLNPSGSSISTKVDYASLLQEFSNAANKVVKEKKSPPKPGLPPHSLKSTSLTKPQTSISEESVSNQGSQKAKNLKDSKSKEKNDKKDDISNNSSKSPMKTNKSGSNKDKHSLNKDVKSNDSTLRKDRDKGQRSDSDRHKFPEKRDGHVDKRSSSEGGRRSPKRGLRKSPPDCRRDNFNSRDPRSNAPRVRDRRDESVKLVDGKTDQFGRMAQEDEKKMSRSKRDRSPINRVKLTREENKPTQGEHGKPTRGEHGKLTRDNGKSTDESGKLNKDETSKISKEESGKTTRDENGKSRNESGKPIDEFGLNKSSDKNDVKNKLESSKPVKVKKVSSSEEIKTKKDEEMNKTNESCSSNIEDVDMRDKESFTKACTTSSDNKEHSITEKTDESKENQLKRKSPKTDNEEQGNEPQTPPYKIPKLSDRKLEDVSLNLGKEEKSETEKQNIDEEIASNKEDISELFGGEDVDYRKIPGAPTPLMIPPPMPTMALLSPVTPTSAALQSPAQQRWNHFKENHPTDFLQDMERKRLRDVQMQSIESVEDVDMRSLARPLPQPKMPIPKDLSMENQEQILRTAEKKLRDGQISHAAHQEIIKQLGQVYDMQRKAHNKEDTPSKSLGLKEDPRVRGLFARDIDKRGPNSEFDNQRRSYGPTSPRYGERPEDMGTSQTSPKEDFISRPIQEKVLRGDPRYLDERRSLAQNYDERLSPRDFDERIQGPYREFNSRGQDNYEPLSQQRREDLDRLQRGKARGTIRRDDHDNRSPNEFLPREDYDRRRPDDHRDFCDDPDYKNRERQVEDRNYRRSPPMRDNDELRLSHMPHQMPPKAGFQRVSSRMTGPLRPEMDSACSTGPLTESRGPMPVPIRPGPLQGPVTGMVQSENVPPLNIPAKKDSNGPMPIQETDQEVIRPLPAAIDKKITDPLDDPRWRVMRGMLENEGSEELVIDHKKFELRMGTSRKLKIYGHMIDVAADLKERGILIDGQLVYKLGEPIKDVPAFGKYVKLYYHGTPKPLWLDGQQHEMRLDAPPRNVMVDGERRGFQIDGRDSMILIDRLEKGTYGGPPRPIRINGIEHEISFQPPPRQISIDGKACKLKLDCKIPCVIIDGKPHGIRFDGEPRPVVINDQTFIIPVDRAEKIRLGQRPMYVAFGGPAHELIIDGKWFEVQFNNMPKDIHLGNRHFVIRLPGPVPKVKILDELPLNMDESRLFSSTQIIPEKMSVPDHTNLISGGIQPTQSPIMQPMVGSGNRPMMQMPGIPTLAMVNQSNQGNPLMLPPGSQPPQQLGSINMTRPMMNPLLQIGTTAGILKGISANLTQPPPNILPTPSSDHSVAMATGLQTGSFNPQITTKPQDNAVPGSAAPSVQPIAQPNLPGILALNKLFPLSTTSAPTPAAPSTSNESSSKPPIDINSLLNNLLKVGLIKDENKTETTSSTGDSVTTEASQTVEENTSFAKEESTPQKTTRIPDLTSFSPPELKKKRVSVIDALHEGIQCHTCATRFTISDHAKYREHLDWHFRQNKMEQELMKVAKNRKWFYSLMDWIQYEELEETEDKNRSEIFEQMKFNDGETPAPKPTIYKALEGKDVIKNPVATGAEGEDVCATCGDPFDQVWNEDTEEWILKNTIKVDGKTYHPVCYEDVTETPTPAATPQKNPLEDQLSQLPIKQEVKEEVKQELNPAPSATGNADATPDITSVKIEPNSMEPSAEGKKSELSALAPKLLSTIASQVQREVIPVSHEDDSSAWDMDSNPTPELSRTPTPEPIVSFTPVTSSASAESVTSVPIAPVLLQEEEPIPIKIEPASPIKAASDDCSSPKNNLPLKQEPDSPNLSPPQLSAVVPGLEIFPEELSKDDNVVKPEPEIKENS